MYGRGMQGITQKEKKKNHFSKLASLFKGPRVSKWTQIAQYVIATCIVLTVLGPDHLRTFKAKYCPVSWVETDPGRMDPPPFHAAWVRWVPQVETDPLVIF